MSAPLVLVHGVRHGPWAWDRLRPHLADRKDRAIPPGAQEAMATHAVRVHHLPSSHPPFLSMPDRLADLIRSESEEFAR